MTAATPAVLVWLGLAMGLLGGLALCLSGLDQLSDGLKQSAGNTLKHTAMLRFDNGNTNTIPVRNDVELSRLKVGEHMVFRFTDEVAIWVEKP